MAIAGGGVPGVQITLHRRQIKRVGNFHNVPAEVIKTPKQAAGLLSIGQSCYIYSVGGAAWAETQAILERWGWVDPLPCTKRPGWWATFKRTIKSLIP